MEYWKLNAGLIQAFPRSIRLDTNSASNSDDIDTLLHNHSRGLSGNAVPSFVSLATTRSRIGERASLENVRGHSKSLPMRMRGEPYLILRDARHTLRVPTAM